MLRCFCIRTAPGCSSSTGKECRNHATSHQHNPTGYNICATDGHNAPNKWDITNYGNSTCDH
jgi:hypothetical protein